MINSEDPIVVDLRTSCTKDEAVAKLLGWMRGPIRRKYTLVTEAGIPVDQLPKMHSIGGPLSEQLADLQEAARMQLVEAAEAGASIEVLHQKQDDVAGWNAQIMKAASYLRDIDDELAKGDESALKTDKRAKKESGVIHLTLSSLDQWARNKYDISIFETAVEKSSEGNSTSQSIQPENEATLNGGLSKLKADNLYTTFAFLVEAFSQTLTKYGKDSKPNVSAIAKHIEAIAAKTSVQDGQDQETIRKLISEAMKRKKKKMDGG